jgi:hypothetical protein
MSPPSRKAHTAGGILWTTSDRMMADIATLVDRVFRLNRHRPAFDRIDNSVMDLMRMSCRLSSGKYAKSNVYVGFAITRATFLS